MSKKLQRYLDEIDRTERKIKELQDSLKVLRMAQKKEEEAEMIRALRGLKVTGKDLMDVLNGLQDGSFVIKKDSENEHAEDTDDPSYREEGETESL